MKSYQKQFIDAAIDAKALGFGEYRLKSGRLSPYFFNAGLLYQGRALSVLAKAYAQVIMDTGFDYDVIFGPAYKGISLAALTVNALYEYHDLDVPFAYNRKEKKDHGEGGQIVGADVTDKKLLVIDDVITAGTAIKEVADLVASKSAVLAGVVVGLDRQEVADGTLSAIQQIEKDFTIKVESIIRLDDIISYLNNNNQQMLVEKISDYQSMYGINKNS